MWVEDKDGDLVNLAYAKRISVISYKDHGVRVEGEPNDDRDRPAYMHVVAAYGADGQMTAELFVTEFKYDPQVTTKQALDYLRDLLKKLTGLESNTPG